MRTASDKELDLNNLFRPEVLANPYPFYHKLRTRDPVHWDRSRKIIVRIAPGTFLIGVLILSALATFAWINNKWPDDGKDYLTHLNRSANLDWALVRAPVFLACAFIVGWFVDINVFSLQNVYGNRLVRCY